jgi:hypothetical protein
MTLVVLRYEGREFALDTLGHALRARGRFGYFEWSFASEDSELAVEGRMRATRDDFVGLRYDNPPGGFKHCLNTKIASCELRIVDKQRGGGRAQELRARNRAAFEILTDDLAHGIPIVV